MTAAIQRYSIDHPLSSFSETLRTAKVAVDLAPWNVRVNVIRPGMIWATGSDRLSKEERRLADLRAAGREWADIADDLGGTAEARRKQLTRAISRVSRELGLDEGDDE